MCSGWRVLGAGVGCVDGVMGAGWLAAGLALCGAFVGGADFCGFLVVVVVGCFAVSLRLRRWASTMG